MCPHYNTCVHNIYIQAEIWSSLIAYRKPLEIVLTTQFLIMSTSVCNYCLLSVQCTITVTIIISLWCLSFPLQLPTTSTDHELDCYDEMAINDFHSPLKKPKLSESSLQRVTPDSGIALGYQSSVSSVDSLSPPMDKLHKDDFTTKFDGGNIIETVTQDIQDSQKRSRSLSEISSNMGSGSLTPGVTTTVGTFRTMSSTSSVVSHYPAESSSPQSPAGTVPLSHAPHAHGSSSLDLNRSPGLMPPRSNSSASSPIHPQSSPNITHSPAAVGSPFQFNSSSPLAHHYPSTISHPPSQNYLSYPVAGSHKPGSVTFPYTAGGSSPNYYSHSSRSNTIPYSNSYHMQSSSSAYQQPAYRSYVQQGVSPSYNSIATSSTSPFKLMPVMSNSSAPSTMTSTSLSSLNSSTQQPTLQSPSATQVPAKSAATLDKPPSLPVARTGSCGDNASSPSSDAKDSISDDPETPTSSEQLYTTR